MSKILEALADDNLCIHPPIYRGSPAYREAVRTMCETAEALEAKLDDGEKELFEKFCNTQDDEGHL